MMLNTQKLKKFNQAYSSDALKTSVYGASPVGIVILLYEGALKAIAQAEQAMSQQHFEEKARQISKSLDIIEGLRLCLDMDTGSEAAQNLHDLYLYMKVRLGRASADNNPHILREISNLLSTILPAWKQIDGRLQQEAQKMTAPIEK